ncbi:zinc-binding dehydrogenase [Roseateles sp. SL47]|uniref:zinc-binding dehydrogenase n=1 Tax=Roseateles sp. SL47 TaxID=2995138 RepID=UPI00226F73DD|nr:zinc-binding dehydrogenase [Roseateles sp. SL47]WAC73171.1 zinc-binding dehydrogenase [Roseateles sp. SL47]
MTVTRAYSVSAEDIAHESERVRGDHDKFDLTRTIRLDRLTLPACGATQVRMRVLAVSAEHNVVHAAIGHPINISAARGGKLFVGNSAVGEVVETGSDVQRFRAGDIVLTHCNGGVDRGGFPVRIWAYDQPDSDGWYAEEAVVDEHQLIAAPIDCGLSLWEIAALSLRAPTAYHLWRRGLGIYRLKVSHQQNPVLNVLSFGGGVGELFLMLAKAEGHRVFYCSGNAKRREDLQRQGVISMDQNQYARFASKDDVKAFVKDCKALTDGEGMHVVCDMLRGPVFEAGLAVSARCGVNVSSGWQLSQSVEYNSTLLSVKQMTIDHMHYETAAGCEEATRLYGKVFKPVLHREIYAFEDLPRCMDDMHKNRQSGIPVVRVAREMPASVKGLL